MFGLERPESQIGVSPFVLFLPGVMYGALFEVVALLPLLLLSRRWKWNPIWTLIGGGALLWAAGVLGTTWATSEIALSQLTLRDIAMIDLPIMIAGVVLVVVFASVLGKRNAA